MKKLMQKLKWLFSLKKQNKIIDCKNDCCCFDYETELSQEQNDWIEFTSSNTTASSCNTFAESKNTMQYPLKRTKK